MSKHRVGQNSRLPRLGFTLAFGLLALAGLLMALNRAPSPHTVLAEGPTIRYVVPAPVGNDDGNDCTDSDTPCATIQYAVDVAHSGDIVQVAAGTYSGVSTREDVAQVVYISKTVTIQGGYTPSSWTRADPDGHPTTLDAQRMGRVLYISGEISPTIEGLRITGGYLAGGRSYGAGVYIVDATTHIRNSHIFSNTAGNGGGLHLRNSPSTLISNTVSANSATSFGGGLGLVNSPATLTGNTIISNTASTGGGLDLLSSDNAVLNDNTITSNTAYFGGGLRLYGSAATLTGNIVSANVADVGGGLSVVESDVALTNNTVCSNTARMYGGGLNLEYASVTLTANTITSNTVWWGMGGGLRLFNSAATLTANVVSANSSTDAGGGLHLYRSLATLTGNTIISNTTATGSGLFVADSDVTLTNNIVSANSADRYGGGLYITASRSQLAHTTVARNRAGDGSGIHIAGIGSTVALTNTILVSHTVGITVSAGSTATLEATLWGADAWANLVDRGGAGTIQTGTLNLWGDPAFVDPGRGDYHLGRNSAAIDHGIDASIREDIDGHIRPALAGYDLGADEFWGRLCLPLVVHDGTHTVEE